MVYNEIMRSNERGFAVIAIIVILVLVLGAIAGYFILQNQKTPAPQQVSSQPSPSADLIQEISPIPTSEASLSPTPTAPVVVFEAAGSFSDSEEEQIRQRVVNPFIAYHQDIEDYADIVSITISHSATPGFLYSVDAVFANGGMTGFLVSSTGGDIDWWLPDCMGECPFTQSFRATYPEIVSQFE